MGAMDDDVDRASILARRARFIAAALAGLAGAAATSSCDCGGVIIEDGNGGQGAGGEGGTPQPCLSMPLGGMGGEGGTPQPCLEAPLGGMGGEGGVSTGEGGTPRPCLAPR